MAGDVSGEQIGGAAGSLAIAGAQGFANPISDIQAAVAVLGVGMSLFGTNKAARAAKEESASSQAIIGLETQANEERRKQMELMASRQQMQNIRNAQLARSMALTSATSQGAQFGSGLQGGFGQIGAEAGTEATNISQNLQIGENIFNIDALINQQRIRQAQAKSQAATGAGEQAFGSSLASFGSSKGFGAFLGNMFPGGGSTGSESSRAIF